MSWECNNKGCSHFDRIGSEHSCNGGRIENCPIVAILIRPEEIEALDVGIMALRDKSLGTVRAYFKGKELGLKLGTQS